MLCMNCGEGPVRAALSDSWVSPSKVYWCSSLLKVHSQTDFATPLLIHPDKNSPLALEDSSEHPDASTIIVGISKSFFITASLLA